jgi:hypothetical protein
MKRTRAQRRRIRQGYTHEIAYWSGRGKPWNFILITSAQTAAYFRKHGLEDDWVRPICPQWIHNGRKPR